MNISYFLQDYLPWQKQWQGILCSWRWWGSTNRSSLSGQMTRMTRKLSSISNSLESMVSSMTAWTRTMTRSSRRASLSLRVTTRTTWAVESPAMGLTILLCQLQTDLQQEMFLNQAAPTTNIVFLEYFLLIKQNCLPYKCWIFLISCMF